SFSITPSSLVALSILPRRLLGSVLPRSRRFGLGVAFPPFYKLVYLAMIGNISCRVSVLDKADIGLIVTCIRHYPTGVL
ncbi:25066_t:CDS:2, partial [Gigaspora rosea]